MKGRSIPVLIAWLALASCNPDNGSPEVRVEGAWVSLPPVQGRPAAGYFTLVGGEAPDRLIGIASRAAERIELHETMSGGGMAGMSPLGQVPVPAGKRVEFEPGGRHAMLFGLDPALAVGGRAPLTFRFASGRSLAVDAELRAPGDAPTG